MAKELRPKTKFETIRDSVLGIGSTLRAVGFLSFTVFAPLGGFASFIVGAIFLIIGLAILFKDGIIEAMNN